MLLYKKLLLMTFSTTLVYEMVACLVEKKNLLSVVSSIMPTPATVMRLTREMEGDGLKLSMANHFSSSQLSSKLQNRKRNTRRHCSSQHPGYAKTTLGHRP